MIRISHFRAAFSLCFTTSAQTIIWKRVWFSRQWSHTHVESWLDFRRPLVSGLPSHRFRRRSTGSFPKQRLLIEPTWIVESQDSFRNRGESNSEMCISYLLQFQTWNIAALYWLLDISSDNSRLDQKVSSKNRLKKHLLTRCRWVSNKTNKTVHWDTSNK